MATHTQTMTTTVEPAHLRVQANTECTVNMLEGELTSLRLVMHQPHYGTSNSKAADEESKGSAMPTETNSIAGTNRMKLRDGLFGRTWGYHAVFLILHLIWLITPFSFVWIGAFVYLSERDQAVSIPLAVLTGFAVAEATFAIYQRYRIWRVKRYVSVSVIAPADREAICYDLFHSDLRTIEAEPVGSGTLELTVDDETEGFEASLGRPPISRKGSTASCLSRCCSETIDSCLSSAEQTRAMAFRQRYSIWFHNAPWEDIHQEDVLTLLSWLLFSLPQETAKHDTTSATLLQKAYRIFQSRSATTFPPGRNPSVKISCLSLDPLNAAPRPLMFYVIGNSLNYLIRTCVLPSLGMTHHIEGDVEYMIRIPRGWTSERGRTDPNATPVMYLHGLGFGLIQNLQVLRPILETLKTHPVIFPIAHHTAQAVCHRNYLKPWTRSQFVRDIRTICEKWGFCPESVAEPDEEKTGRVYGGLSVISHSNGSVHHGWLIKDCPQLIRRHLFADPIIFCLDEGFTCHAFCYRKPTTPFHLLLQCLISSELGISNYIQRHFHWSDNCLYIDDHPELLDPSVAQFFLGKKDVIVDAPRVREYLESYGASLGANINWNEEAGHGKALKKQSLARALTFAGTGVMPPL